MMVSDEGIKLIKRWEGCRIKAYKCPAGVWTIGYGHTKGVKEGDIISKREAEQLLRADLSRFEKGVNRKVAVDLTQGQYDALISFSYNVGLGNFSRSTLLKKLNKEKIAEAADEFLRWNRAGGRVLDGLTARRKAERELFLS